LGIVNDKSVFFLGLFILIVLIFDAFIYVKKTTPYGRQILKDLENKYLWAKSRKRNVEYVPDGFDPITAAAIYGIATLAFFPDFGGFYETFKRNNSEPSSSGCTSCSSDSSSSSGGSDGGSGCSGGGCGGCGGD